MGVGAPVGAAVGAQDRWLQACCCRRWHCLPPYSASFWMSATRKRVPPPHDREQPLHGSHAETQSSLQWKPLQLRVAVVGGHDLPPKRGVRVMVRVDCCLPPPHGLLQLDQRPHGATAQSKGSGVGEGVRCGLGRGVGCLDGNGVGIAVGCGVGIAVVTALGQRCAMPTQLKIA